MRPIAAAEEEAEAATRVKPPHYSLAWVYSKGISQFDLLRFLISSTLVSETFKYPALKTIIFKILMRAVKEADSLLGFGL